MSFQEHTPSTKPPYRHNPYYYVDCLAEVAKSTPPENVNPQLFTNYFASSVASSSTPTPMRKDCAPDLISESSECLVLDDSISIITAASPDVSLDEALRMMGRYAEIALTPTGSRFVQTILEVHFDEVIPFVIMEVGARMAELMLDPFGCYVIRALILSERLALSVKLALLTPLVENDAHWLSLACKSLHTRRLLTGILDTLPPQHLDFLFRMLRTPQSIHTLVSSKEGCVTIQRLADLADVDSKEKYFAHLRANFGTYARHPHATYVIQSLVLTPHHLNTVAVCEIFRKDISLVCNRNGSTIVEQVLSQATDSDGIRCAISIVFSEVPVDVFCVICNDPYGNYTTQKLIQLAPQDLAQQIMFPRLRACLPYISFGKKLLNQLYRRCRTASSKQPLMAY